jgi:hypothetical protein
VCAVRAGAGSSCSASFPVRKCCVTCFIEPFQGLVSGVQDLRPVPRPMRVPQPAPLDNQARLHAPSVHGR